MANSHDSNPPRSGSKNGSNKEKKRTPEFNLGEEIVKRLAATEKDRKDQARRLAAHIQRKTVLAAGTNQNGGAPPANETPELLRNMCGILNRGFSGLGLDMRNLKSSFDTQLNALSDNLESNCNDLWGDGAGQDDWPVDGDEAEPAPPRPFKMGSIFELSDEEEGEDDQEMMENHPPAALGAAPAPEGPVNPGGLDNFFARFARSLRVPTDVGDNLNKSLAELVKHSQAGKLWSTPSSSCAGGHLGEGARGTEGTRQKYPEATW